MICTLAAPVTFPASFSCNRQVKNLSARELPVLTGSNARKPENLGVLLFDADGDLDLDLYCASGSNEFTPDTEIYQDQFFTMMAKEISVLTAVLSP